MTDTVNHAEWEVASWDSRTGFAGCRSCHRNLATRKVTGWTLAFGHRTKGKRHPNGLPWFGWSETGIRRVHGLNRPNRSAPAAWADQRFRPPVVVTCKCGAENLVDLAPEHPVVSA